MNVDAIGRALLLPAADYQRDEAVLRALQPAGSFDRFFFHPQEDIITIRLPRLIPKLFDNNTDTASLEQHGTREVRMRRVSVAGEGLPAVWVIEGFLDEAVLGLLSLYLELMDSEGKWEIVQVDGEGGGGELDERGSTEGCDDPASSGRDHQVLTMKDGNKGAHLVAIALARTAAAVFQLPEDFIDQPIQVPRYKHGEFYDIHHDDGNEFDRFTRPQHREAFFSETKSPQANWASLYAAMSERSDRGRVLYEWDDDTAIRNGPGTRIATVLLYLNTPSRSDAGGRTVFPLVADSAGNQLAGRPQLNKALIFPNILNAEGQLDPRMFHFAEEITNKDAEKAVVNLWVCDRPRAMRMPQREFQCYALPKADKPAFLSRIHHPSCPADTLCEACGFPPSYSFEKLLQNADECTLDSSRSADRAMWLARMTTRRDGAAGEWVRCHGQGQGPCVRGIHSSCLALRTGPPSGDEWRCSRCRGRDTKPEREQQGGEPAMPKASTRPPHRPPNGPPRGPLPQKRIHEMLGSKQEREAGEERPGEREWLMREIEAKGRELQAVTISALQGNRGHRPVRVNIPAFSQAASQSKDVHGLRSTLKHIQKNIISFMPPPVAPPLCPSPMSPPSPPQPPQRPAKKRRGLKLLDGDGNVVAPKQPAHGDDAASSPEAEQQPEVPAAAAPPGAARPAIDVIDLESPAGGDGLNPPTPSPHPKAAAAPAKAAVETSTAGAAPLPHQSTGVLAASHGVREAGSQAGAAGGGAVRRGGGVIEGGQTVKREQGNGKTMQDAINLDLDDD
ncbi:unnamed protein product [Vitrella brassicaformis CCMP3155]|uniref:Prolyl 4-hydroxylase alpha subunit domain-containing protein n=2 Tax=Vitrella brassicaformis TaxID=1169539 RepID=A0A0G4FH64_VITBC|nr:unnamed protein product [Vitrella brassicaformis CCMP3155]|eukprot:CEM12631.1 unnamed protein product [Vitrella brassicaformis CCMP3155]